jgi:hypothetical protein
MIILSATLLALFLSWQAYMTIMANTTEQQQYRVVERRGEVEIRFYPSAHRANVQVMSREGDYDFMRNRGFRELGGYIFGNNERREQIAMTAPVVMSVNASDSGLFGTMAFTMPQNFNPQSRPRPNSDFIAFSTTEPMYTASLSTGGFPKLNEMNMLRDRLFAALREEGLQHNSTAEYLYYNPPTQMLGRRNEVLVRLVGYNE